ncbi:MAG: ParB/RepB/Spo0J family partition protein, partial [Desulfovibrio sp.]
MSINKGLGRGLDALFNGAAKSAEDVAPQKLQINEIMPNPAQPRRYFIDQSLQELADSILAQGILQPILVRPMDDGKYQIIAGERRWRAANLAGLNAVPVIVRSMNDTEAMAAALIENLQREDLNPIEEARALASLRETLDISQDELASRLGKSRPAIANAIRLLQLSQQAQDDVANGKLSPGHARCLLGIADQNMADALRIKILDTSMTVREAEK